MRRLFISVSDMLALLITPAVPRSDEPHTRRGTGPRPGLGQSRTGKRVAPGGEGDPSAMLRHRESATNTGVLRPRERRGRRHDAGEVTLSRGPLWTYRVNYRFS